VQVLSQLCAVAPGTFWRSQAQNGAQSLTSSISK
jgi:hypothetical protein